MHYLALAVIEDSIWNISFPDCPGCVALSDDPSTIVKEASEALDGWLETMISFGRDVSRPSLAICAPPDGQAMILAIPVREELSKMILAKTSP